MIRIGYRLAATTSLFLGLLASPIAAQAVPSHASAGSSSMRLAQKAGTPEAAYQRARKELPEDVYLVYRIMDRLARANGLDERPWRIGIVPKYDLNAFATELNLIAVFDGLLDQVDGDPDALACVLGHEMGHHIKRHIATSATERAKIYEQLKAEAEQEAMAEAQATQRDSNNARAGGAVARTLGGLLGGIGGTVGNVAGSALENESRQRVARGEQRIQEILATKKAAIEKKWSELDHGHEFEADEQGYLYMVRAGFDPKGCTRMMEVLNQLPGGEMSSNTHPAIPERIEALKKVSTKNPLAKLVSEGKSRLAARKQPLSYSLSRDRQSLRINSQRGSRDVDQQLPR